MNRKITVEEMRGYIDDALTPGERERVAAAIEADPEVFDLYIAEVEKGGMAYLHDDRVYAPVMERVAEISARRDLARRRRRYNAVFCFSASAAIMVLVCTGNFAALTEGTAGFLTSVSEGLNRAFELIQQINM